MNRKLFGLALCGALSFTGSAFAEEAPPENHPCKDIVAACKAAGYVKGGAKEGKSLRKDCMHPILAGQTVEGVNVNADEVKACQARIAEKHEKHHS